MDFRVALHKLDARRVLPVAHGLFEEGFVQAAEVAVDLVGDDTVIPNALLFGGYSTRHAIAMLRPLQVAVPGDNVHEEEREGERVVRENELWSY